MYTLLRGIQVFSNRRDKNFGLSAKEQDGGGFRGWLEFVRDDED